AAAWRREMVLDHADRYRYSARQGAAEDCRSTSGGRPVDPRFNLLLRQPRAAADSSAAVRASVRSAGLGYDHGARLSALNYSDTTSVFNCPYNFNVLHNSFSISLAEIALEKKPTADSRAGFRVDLDFGSTSNIVHAAEPAGTTTYQNLQQAYVSYLAPAGKGG